MAEEHRYLLSRSTLDDYLSFVNDYALNPADINRREHVEAWKTADLFMRQLREEDPDRADAITVEPVPSSLNPFVDRVKADPHFRKSFDETSWEIGLVDLDGVIASQKLVSAVHVQRLQKRLTPKLDAEALFKFCLPFDRPIPAFKASRISDDEFAFTSQSNDLRFLEAVMLRPDQIQGYQTTGPIAGIVAFAVGFGSNYLNVIRANDRYVLNNGNHRACALYQSGYRKVPCVIQTITHPGEFEVHMPRPVQRRPDYYLTDPRPPLVADYFHEVLGKSIPLGLTTKQVRLRYTVEEKDMP